MKDRNIDQYIAIFCNLAHHVGLNLNEPTNISQFASGLPIRLTESCINYKWPDMFDGWAAAAQQHQKAWLQKQALKGMFNFNTQAGEEDAALTINMDPGTGVSWNNRQKVLIEDREDQTVEISLLMTLMPWTPAPQYAKLSQKLKRTITIATKPQRPVPITQNLFNVK